MLSSGFHTCTVAHANTQISLSVKLMATVNWGLSMLGGKELETGTCARVHMHTHAHVCQGQKITWIIRPHLFWSMASLLLQHSTKACWDTRIPVVHLPPHCRNTRVTNEHYWAWLDLGIWTQIVRLAHPALHPWAIFPVLPCFLTLVWNSRGRLVWLASAPQEIPQS